MRFSLVALVLCLGFVSDAVSAPSVRVLGAGGAGYATSGETGLASAPGIKATAVNTANRVNTSVLGATGGGSAKKSASIKVGSTPAATSVQPIARTANNTNISRIGSVSANAVNGTGRIPAMRLQNKIQTTYRPVQAVQVSNTEPTPVDVDLSNYYTKPEIEDMRTEYYTKPEVDDLLDSLGIENITNLSETVENHETTLQEITQKLTEYTAINTVDRDDFDEAIFDD